MSKVIMIGGKKRSGKDTTAAYIKEYLRLQGKTVEIISFADTLKGIMALLFDTSVQEIDYYKNNPSKVWVEVLNHDNLVLQQTDFRRLLQILGTECRDKYFGRNIWVDIAKGHILAARTDYVIIPDLRFPFEYEGVLSDFDTKTIKITRDQVGVIDNHLSEIGLDDFVADYSITNNGTIDELKDKLAKVLSNF